MIHQICHTFIHLSNHPSIIHSFIHSLIPLSECSVVMTRQVEQEGIDYIAEKTAEKSKRDSAKSDQTDKVNH